MSLRLHSFREPSQAHSLHYHITSYAHHSHLSKLSVLLLFMVGIDTNSAVIVDTRSAQSRVHVVVLVKGVHLVLGVVEVVEQDPDQAAGNERSDSQTAEHPHDRGVVQEGVQRLGDGGSERVGEQVHGLDERLHAGRRFGVGVLETSDRGENLGNTDEHVGAGLGGNVDVVTLGNTIDLAGIAERVAITGTSLVDVMLDDSGVDHGKRGDPEPSGDTVDGREVDLVLAEEREEELIHDRQEDDNGNGIEVLHQIVRDTVTSHLTSLGNKVVGEVSVYDPVNRVETKHLACHKRPLNLINEVVVPKSGGGLAETSLVRRLRAIHVASLDHLADHTEGVGNDRALRWANDVDLATEDKDERTDEEDAQTQQVSRPEVGITLHVGSREEGQRTNVDALKMSALRMKSEWAQTYPIEDHVDTGDGDGRVNDDALARLLVGTNDHLATLVLIGNQGSDVGLDTTSSETDNNNSSDKTTKTGASLKSNRDRSQGKDEKTDHVDTTEDDNGVVLSEVLISNDSTENGCDIAPELEEGRETSGSLVSHADSTTSFAAIKRALDVVLENTRGTVVGKALAQFYNGDQEGGLGQRLADLAQGAELLRGGLDASKTVIDLDVTDGWTRTDAQRLFDEVLLGDASASDIVVVQRQAVQVRVLVGLSLLALQLVGTERTLAHTPWRCGLQNIRGFLCGSHGWYAVGYNQRSSRSMEEQFRVRKDRTPEVQRAAAALHLTQLPPSSIPPVSSTRLRRRRSLQTEAKAPSSDKQRCNVLIVVALTERAQTSGCKRIEAFAKGLSAPRSAPLTLFDSPRPRPPSQNGRHDWRSYVHDFE